MTTKKCPVCGKTYTPVHGKSWHACEECTRLIIDRVARVRELPRGEKNRYCVVCGKEILHGHGKQFTCGGKCSYIVSRINDTEKNYGIPGAKAYRKWQRRNSTSAKVDADNAAAKAAGLTYGEYMARKVGLV